MKLFRLTIGNIDTYGVGEDLEDMEARKAEVDHTFAFLPVVIEEVVIPGYEIVVNRTDATDAQEAPRRGGRRKAE